MLIKFENIQKAEENNKSYDPGKYNVRIIKVEEKTSQAGNDYIRITYETIGENVFKINANYFPDSEKALSILLNVLSAVGLYDKNNPSELNFDNNDLLGRKLELELVLGEAQDNGKQYLEVKPWSANIVNEEDCIPF